ncbi:MAG: VOC family protein [Dehalococcoidia bacterium]|nr:VOC family protein [Dehalococcoidia bacterium]
MADDAITGVNGVLIWTDNFDAMLHFYRDVLGLEPRSVKEQFVNFAWGDFRLTISVHEHVHGKNPEPDRFMLNFGVEDIDAVYERLTAAGVSFTRPPSREPWGGKVATFHDPDGNTLQLLQP